DILGALTATTGLVAVVYGFSHAQTDGWGDAVTVAMLAGGAALLALFAWLESRLANPLLPLRVVLDRDRGGSYLAMGLAAAGMFGVFLFLTYYLQQTLGFSPITTGDDPADPRRRRHGVRLARAALAAGHGRRARPRLRAGAGDRDRRRCASGRRRRLGDGQHVAAGRRLDRNRAAEHAGEQRGERLDEHAHANPRHPRGGGELDPAAGPVLAH